MTRAEQIQERFDKFHAANPKVWELFEEYTMKLIAGRWTHYSADAVCHRIRWHMAIEVKSGDGFKINDHYTCLYARMFEEKHPEHDGFFRKRHRPSDHKQERMGGFEVGKNKEVV